MDVATKYKVELQIMGLPSISANGPHGHWATKAKERKLWHSLVAYNLGRRLPPKPLEKAKLTLIRHSSSEPDSDGLVISFKPVIDALVKAGVLVNDKRGNIGMPEYDWRQAPPKKGFITIKIEEL